jgi:glycosyltransferase involved in cell wall biosynthesis
MRILFVQYAGDYREASLRLRRGGPELYYAQKYSVNFVANLLEKASEVAVICCITSEIYDEVLPSGVRAIGLGLLAGFSTKLLFPLIRNLKPTHLVLRFPDSKLLQFVVKQRIDTIALLADSFSAETFRAKWRNYKTGRALSQLGIRWVANHNVSASRSLAKIGVSPDKIVPYDFPATISPAQQAPKTLPRKTEPWKLFFIGELSVNKGLGDLLDAVTLLKSQEFAVELDVVGNDKEGVFARIAQAKGIAQSVNFLGYISNADVVPYMRKADAVIVPSRHKYPEGFPLTIYHVLCSRTPLIASDHPMFLPSLTHGIDAQIFQAGNPEALAIAIKNLLSDPNLYEAISLGSLSAWEKLQVPVLWSDMIERWISGSAEDSDWIFKHRLSSGLYDDR